MKGWAAEVEGVGGGGTREELEEGGGKGLKIRG